MTSFLKQPCSISRITALFITAVHVSIKYGFNDPLGAPATAGAAGVRAIGKVNKKRRSGYYELCRYRSGAGSRHAGLFHSCPALCGGYEDDPHYALRPFDRHTL